MRMHRIITRKLLTLLLVTTGALAEAAPAQESSAQQRLERARLLQEIERDPEGAAAAYRELLADGSLSVEVRKTATRSLITCLDKLGQAEEAGAVLRQAAEEGTLDVKEVRAAQAALGTDASDGRLRARISVSVKKLLAAVRTSTERLGSKVPGFADLVWIGAPAVPILAEEIFEHPDDLAAASALTEVICAIGGPPAAEFVRRAAAAKDGLFKRAILKGLPYGNAGDSPPVREAARAFLSDPDEQLRGEALARFSIWLDDATLLALLEDPAPALRRRVMSIAASRVKDAPLPPRLLEALRQAIHATDPEEQAPAFDLLSNPDLLRDAAGIALFVTAMAKPLVQPEQGTNWANRLGSSINERELPALSRNITPADLLAMARALGTRSVAFDRHGNLQATWPPTQHGRVLLDAIIDRLTSEPGFLNQSPRPRLDPWPDVDRRPLFEILRLGGYPHLQEWAQRSARPSELPWIAEAALASADVALLDVVAQRAKELDAATRPAVVMPLARLLDRVAAGDFGTCADWPRRHPAERVFRSLYAIDGADAAEVLVRWAKELPEHRASLTEYVTNLKDPAAIDAQVVLLNLPLEPATKEALNARAGLFSTLVKRGVAQALAVLPELYEEAERLAINISPAHALATNDPALDRLPPDALRETMTALLVSGVQSARVDALYVATAAVSSRQDDPATRAVIEAAVDGLAALPGSVSRVNFLQALVNHQIESRVAFFTRLLGDPGQREPLLGILANHFRNPSLPPLPPALSPALVPLLSESSPTPTRLAAVRALARCGDRTVWPHIVALLASQDAVLRQDAIESLALLQAVDAAGAVRERLADPDDNVREAAVRAAGQLLVTEAIPALIELLRDPAPKVRTAAAAALEKLQFYVDQKSRWARLAQAGGLDATSAAAALIEQAKAGGKPDVRLAAIAALGTLGVAETLPQLITWMGDADPAVAAAAKAAVDRINARAVPKSADGGGRNPGN